MGHFGRDKALATLSKNYFSSAVGSEVGESFSVKICGIADKGGPVPSFGEMVDFALVEVDFDDPTTNVGGRRALGITKKNKRSN